MVTDRIEVVTNCCGGNNVAIYKCIRSIKWYTLNLHNVICLLYVNKAEVKFKKIKLMHVQKKVNGQ